MYRDKIRGLSSCGKIYHANDRGKLRICILVNGIETTFLTALSNGDLTIILLNIKKHDGENKSLIIGSVYMSYDPAELPPQQEVGKLVAHAKKSLELILELILECDANSHYLIWHSTNNSRRGGNLLEFVLDNKLHILNRRNKLTFVDSRRQEVIDITICLRGIVDLVTDCRVSNKPSGSDHRQVHYILQQIELKKIWARNPRNTDWENYRVDFKK